MTALVPLPRSRRGRRAEDVVTLGDAALHAGPEQQLHLRRRLGAHLGGGGLLAEEEHRRQAAAAQLEAQLGEYRRSGEASCTQSTGVCVDFCEQFE